MVDAIMVGILVLVVAAVLAMWMEIVYRAGYRKCLLERAISDTWAAHPIEPLTAVQHLADEGGSGEQES